MKTAGPLGGLASLLLLLTGAPAGFMTALIWNSIQTGSRLWFSPLDTTLLVVILCWGPLWVTRVTLVSRRAVALSASGTRRWFKAVEMGALAVAVALFGLGFVLTPDSMN